MSALRARNALDTALRAVAVYFDKIAPKTLSEYCLVEVDGDGFLDIDLDEIPSIGLSELWGALLEAYSPIGQDKLASWVQGKKGAYEWIEVWHEFNHGHTALIPTIEQIQDVGDSRLGKLYTDYVSILEKMDSCDLTPIGDTPAQVIDFNALKGQEMEELQTIKKELESKAQALAEALGRIAELEQELAGLQAELEGATEEELDEGVDTPYTYIARQPKDRNRRMGMLVAIIERAEGAGLLEKQMNTQRLKWSEDFNNTQIAYFVARANSLLGIKAKRYKATNWGVWCRLIDGLKSTQLSQGKTDYTRQDEDGKPDNYELIDGLFVSL